MTFRISWARREPPLEPAAVVARGAAARRLAQRLLTSDLSHLRGVAGPGMLLVLGPAASLPWVDGVEYLGKDTRAPSLLMPTLWDPEHPPQLVEAALLRKAGGRSPLAVLPAQGDAHALVPLDLARAVDKPALEAWLAENP